MTLGLAQSVDSFTQNNVHDVNSLTPLMNTSRISEGHRQNVRTWRPVVTGIQFYEPLLCCN